MIVKVSPGSGSVGAWIPNGLLEESSATVFVVGIAATGGLLSVSNNLNGLKIPPVLHADKVSEANAGQVILFNASSLSRFLSDLFYFSLESF